MNRTHKYDSVYNSSMENSQTKKSSGRLVRLVVILIGIVAVTGLLYMYAQRNAEESVIETTEKDTYVTHEDSAYGIEFDYRVGPNGYIVQNLNTNVDVSNFEYQYTLTPRGDYEQMESTTGGSEWPPSISIAIYSNDEKMSTSQWVDAYPLLSNIELASGEVNRDAVTGGANAVRYMVDGLYMTDTATVANGEYIYIFSGAFLDSEAPIRQDFIDLIESVEFTPVE